MSLKDHLLLRWTHVKRYVHPVEFLLLLLLVGRSLLVVLGTYNPYSYGILYDKLATGEDVVASIFGLIAGALYLTFWISAARFHMWYRLRHYGSRLMFSVYASLFFFFVTATGTSPVSWSFLVEVLACIYVIMKVARQQTAARADRAGPRFDAKASLAPPGGAT